MTPWAAACQASPSFTISWSLLKLVYRINDAIQPSHPLLHQFPHAFSLSQHTSLNTSMGFPGDSDSKEFASSADLGSIPGSGRSPGGKHGNPLQYSCLEYLMDGGAWWPLIHRAAKSWTRLKWLSMHVYKHDYVLISRTANVMLQGTGELRLPISWLRRVSWITHMNPILSQRSLSVKGGGKEAKMEPCSIGRTPQPNAYFENEVGAASNGI